MSHLPPRVRPPTRERLREIAERYYLDPTEEELDDFLELAAGQIAICEWLDDQPLPHEPRRHRDREPGYRPGADEDPHNALVTRCLVRGADSGPLSGYDVTVKDNVAVGGVEMTAASKVLEGYVPTRDAVVVARLLDAGATVNSKSNMDEFAVSGSGELSAFGPVLNPHSEDHLAGGSSGGSAVAVVTGDADVAIGTDQAGSLRMPAAWSGCVGLKPTHGLVPYRGAIAQGHSWDHVGPMARTVADTARVLDVIAGPDDLDPRSRVVAEAAGGYVDALDAGVEDLTVGRLAEGFGTEHSQDGVDEAARSAVDALGDAGAAVETVSVPDHERGVPIAIGIETEEAAAMFDAEGQGYFAGGDPPREFSRAFANARRARADEFAPTVKLVCLVGGYLAEEYAGRYYGRAQTLRRELAAAYDDALEDVDLLAMPTTPVTAFEVAEDLSRVELVNRSQGKAGRTTNTMPFNVTGHPAVSVPCGFVDGLPTGLMLVGRPFEEATVLRAARAFEAAVDWEETAF